MSTSYEHLVETTPARDASGDKPSRSPGYRHVKHKEPPRCEYASTLYEIFQHSVKEHGEKPCLGHRPKNKDGLAGDYTFLTYSEVADKVKAFAASLRAAGVRKPERLAVFGTNCPEWMIAMQATNHLGLECVPLYDTLGENAIEYIIDHSESTFVVVGGAKLPAFVKALPQIKQKLKGVVYWGKDVSQSDLKALEDKGITATQFDQFVADGVNKDGAADPPAKDDVCTIMYTSGTTGNPKGVMLTHNAVVCTVESLKAFLKDNSVAVDSNDRTLSYLPLAHIFDRSLEEMFLSIGGAIGYWQGDLGALVDDIGKLRPTIFIGVPRVYDRIYSKAGDTVASAGFVKRSLFNWGFKAKLNRLKAGFESGKAAPFWDKLVFNKMKARLGGHVRAIVSGGAPLAPHVEEWLKVAMCAPVVQGYGLTETCAASLIAMPNAWRQHGTVGPPLPVTEVCLESVTEMKYDARGSPARGELLLRGPNNFKGYYKDQEKTDECLYSDGWFATGDIAELQPDGAIKIIDRKKNIFKLAQGEYVAAEKLEGDYKKCSDINQIWVYGNSFERHLVAIVVPKEESLTEWAKSKGVSYSDFADLCAKPEARDFILAALAEQAKLAKLKGFEYIKNCHLEPEEFSQANDLVTPTFKLKRPQLKERYEGTLDALYKEIKDK